MRHATLGEAHLLRLETGEEVVASLLAFAGERGIGAASVSGIGAAYAVRLGWFDRASRSYVRREVEGEVEIAALAGTLARKDGQPFAHLHAVVSGPDFAALAGHLFEARAAATVELVVRPLGGEVARVEDPATGLFLLDL